MSGTLIKAIDSVGDPPLPIPNREVKPVSADGTAKIRGRVVGLGHYKAGLFNASLYYTEISPAKLFPMRRRTSSTGRSLPKRYISFVSAASTVESCPLMTPASSNCRPVS